ncbi:CinA family nicotinamide mononucleotide deamidase-related protein [Staphylococcus felis]|uniref:Putative competence-damage inducible protein n=1 Tax=Staphylococcus felis TaxID=46127 RepID=A0ABS0QL22_9STAP|nr:CinA family nicotinamide mononucleotide deamidase-related protein [Staphylococcus felis]MBH9579913.1 CinA family nicotinamide mononucleotide deamidase-related protein [Staphylococcus felis]MDM8327073.1 CinA family nicotinamide mononucleotide deamidase-related protein [Staphylococcus felis]MDQ7193586.1 CinA family nicotinamide mononucleotide deamidase-related protein [Staphylococcus felis]
MDVCIIAVGSELLLGQITNTNAQYLSKKLNEAGYHVKKHIVVGDNKARLTQVSKNALEQFDIIIYTGGLGPTKDDLTKQTIAKMLNKSLVMDSEALIYIERYFKAQGKVMTPNNKQQALVIEGAHVLKNKVGMAPGIFVEYGNKAIVMLPGPPKEMKPMVDYELMPLLYQEDQTIYSEVLRFCGIGESQIETELIDLIETQDNPTIAPLAGAHEVTIRLTADGRTVEDCQRLIRPVKEEILNRVGRYYYGLNDTTPERAVMNRQKHSIAIYDGVTQGLLYSRLKTEDVNNHLKGYLIDHDIYLNHQRPIQQQLQYSVALVQQLFNTSQAITILSNGNNIHVGFLSHDQYFECQFKMSDERQLKRDRSQNYVLIEWLNWLKS